MTATSQARSQARSPTTAGSAEHSNFPDRDVPARDEVAVAHFVEQTAAVLADLGMQRMPARVLILLSATEDPGLTARELATALKVSPAAISGAVRVLAHLGFVERVAAPGQRRDRYRLPDDAWYVASIAKQPVYRRIADFAAEGVVGAGGSGTVAGARLAEMQDFFDYCDREVPGLVEAWHADRARRYTQPDPEI